MEIHLELIAAVDRPGVVVLAAEFGGELAGVAVDGEDALGPDSFDRFEESGEVGVIRERKGGIDAEAVGSAGV